MWAKLEPALVASCLACLVASCSDEAGRAEAEPTTPQRIVVIAPAAAEMLTALGAAENVVGVGDFVEEPALDGLPRVGAYDTPSFEQVLSLGTDLLITTSSQAGADAHRRLEALGVPVLALETSTYDGVFASLSEVGRAVGRPTEARVLAEGLRSELDAIRRRAAGLPARRVLFVVGRDPLYVAGPGSHIDEMIALAGGENVAGDAISPYPQVSIETILERMPEVIVDASDNRPGVRFGRAAGSWGRWEFLPAVREGRVWQVDPRRLVIPGIRLPEMSRLMARLIHPEAFGEPSVEELGPEARDAKASDAAPS